MTPSRDSGGIDQCSPKHTPVTAQILHFTCTQIFRIFLGSAKNEALDSNLVSTVRRASGSMVLWARDYNVAEGALDRQIGASGRLYQRLTGILGQICNILLHRLLPIVKKFSNPDTKKTEENAKVLLESLIEHHIEHESVSSLTIQSPGQVPCCFEESVEDLEERISCLIDASSTVEDTAHPPAINEMQRDVTEISSGPKLDNAVVPSTRLAEESRCENKRANTYSDANSGLDEESYESFTRSFGSSIIKLFKAHFLCQWAYYMPQLDPEIDIQDLKHSIITELLKKFDKNLIVSPISHTPEKILDLGTGTGIWAIDVADEYPNTEVIGRDISAIQPTWCPPNVWFEIDDFELEWDSRPDRRKLFDLIHSSETVLAVKDWDHLLISCFQHLNPGGWLELKFFDYSLKYNDKAHASHSMMEIWGQMICGLSAMGVDPTISEQGRLAEMLKQNGFIKITEDQFRAPLGAWAKDPDLKKVGILTSHILNSKALWEGPLGIGLKWDPEQVSNTIADFQNECRKLNQCHMWLPFRVICAQKPISEG